MYKSLIAGSLLGLATLAAASQPDSISIADRIGAYFEHKTVIIPKDESIHRGGEDSADASETYLVVADGVGGWIYSGVDPGFFSRKLTSYAVELYEETEGQEAPAQYLEKACTVAANEFQGTATITTLQLKDKNTLVGANFGDSGYALFHVNEDDTLEMYFRTKEMQHMWNFPLQCGTQGDKPIDGAEVVEHEYREGDVVLAFSDGYHDNIYDSGFVQCIEAYLEGGVITSLAGAADCQAKKAYFLGKSTTIRSPFEAGFKKAVESGEELPNGRPPRNYNFLGGKQDDITVTVAQIFHTQNGQRKGYAEQDTYFSESKKVYTEDEHPIQRHEKITRVTKKPVNTEL